MDKSHDLSNKNKRKSMKIDIFILIQHIFSLIDLKEFEK